MSAAAARVSCWTWRVPATLPQWRVNACSAAWNEPRTASVAAWRARVWEWRWLGRFSTASAGYRLRAPSARKAQRVTWTVPNTVAVLLAHGPQVQVVLVQQPQRLPALNVKVVLELVVGPAGRLGTGEGGHQGFEGATGGGEGVEAFLQAAGAGAGVAAGVGGAS